MDYLKNGAQTFLNTEFLKLKDNWLKKNQIKLAIISNIECKNIKNIKIN